MAKFRFRLQVVLGHREMIEREKQRVVGLIERERLSTEETIRAIHAEIERENGDIRARLAVRGPTNLAGVRAAAAAVGRLHAEARRQVLHLSGAMHRLESARAELLEAAKRRKAVELLRERRLDEWRLDQSRRETAAVDELSVMRAGRARDEEMP